MLGTLLGLIVVASLTNGLTHLGMSSTNQQFVLGILIVLSAIDWKRKNK
jgi:ribose/xylose/arabinose/galactoside ABC-type transport system permease subunit